MAGLAGIYSSDDLASILSGIGPGPGKPLKNGRAAWFDDHTGIVLIFNPGSADKGTAFIPRQGRSYYDKILH